MMTFGISERVLPAGVATRWLHKQRQDQLEWWQLLTAGEWSYQRSINTLHEVYATGTVVWYE